MRHSISFALLFFALALLFQADAKASEPWPDLSVPHPATQEGNQDAVVIVGLEDYIFAPDIPGAIQNADDWYTYFAETRGVPYENITLLRNNQGTREKILKEVQKASQKVKKEGKLWFVFIGHGAPSANQKEGLLLGADAQNEVDSLDARGIQQKEILKAARASKTPTIMVLDACFSGQNRRGKPLLEGLQPLVPVQGNSSVKHKALIFTAGGPDEYAGPLPNQKRPAFSYLMLGAIRGWADKNKDNVVTAQEALGYTRHAMTTLIKDRSQTPSLSAQKPEMALTRKASEAPPNLHKTGSPKNEPTSASNALGLFSKEAIVSQPFAIGSIMDAQGTGTTTKTRLPDAVAHKSTVTIAVSGENKYEARFLAFDGSVHSCPQKVSAKIPCVLENVSRGQGVIEWNGSPAYTIAVTSEDNDYIFNEPNGWTTVLGMITVAGVAGGLTYGTLGLTAKGGPETTTMLLGYGGSLASVILGPIAIVFAGGQRGFHKIPQEEQPTPTDPQAKESFHWNIGPGTFQATW